jgi:hypothetical protein
MMTLFRVTGHVLTSLPFMLIAMGLYIASATVSSQDAFVGGVVLPSGQPFSVTLGAGTILIGIACLMLEVLKSTHTGTRGLIDQTLSVFLLGASGVAFLLLPAFGTVTFAILVALQLADVLLGTIVGIKVARRDIGLNA